MKKPFSVILIISFFLLSTLTVSFAGSRHGYRSYSSHYGGGYSHHRYSGSHHYSHSNYYWGYLGIGLLTGALIGSALYQPPRPQTVYYTSPRTVVVQSEPVIIRQQPIISSPTPPPELILRQVKITGKIVNIRSGPGLENPVVTQAYLNEQVNVIGAAPEWLYVKTRDGRYGWLMGQYTREIDRPVG